jgi:hypothetical protein
MFASQLERMVRKGARVFMAMIRPVMSNSASLVVTTVATVSPVPTTVVQPGQPAGPPGSEVPWVSDLLSEFSEVFQDPPPAGLPTERSKGHNIPTESGHPPPFWLNLDSGLNECPSYFSNSNEFNFFIPISEVCRCIH